MKKREHPEYTGSSADTCTAATTSDGSTAANDGTADDGAANDGSADDGTINDGSGDVADVWTTAGKCTAGTIPAFTGAVPGNFQPENIDLIMDVPLEVTVELGRTSKSIKEILDFTPGTIIELNRIAGEPIDVLVNGKFVAKGEVVVIEESYGIRITEIIK